ncbi:uncharacterized protein B0P05DRAFT_594561 [Gilbertella persicaria]|uniref:uncharacterized protein n=1 Tax=Gilbertella persicaria TaxID=101096 RepID=UPI002220EB24|nr:uncharacterized protein B0P05DRAFT_594561 [Gilbertella persicaria]KAI8090223.1 hypothetical protein B0P05DRAFT_594561 [Gilbertella persicaria]
MQKQPYSNSFQIHSPNPIAYNMFQTTTNFSTEQINDFDYSNMMTTQHTLYGDGISLAEAASICSSNDTPDVAPVADKLSISSETVVAQQQPIAHENQYNSVPFAMTQWASHLAHYQPDGVYSDEDYSMTDDIQTPTVQWCNHVTSGGAISATDTEQYQNLYPIMTEQEPHSTCIPKDSSHYHRKTVLYMSSDNLCDTTENELRRKSMNDLVNQKSFCHLSREELIQRVLELEKEKQLSKKSLEQSDGSDEDEIHPCRWSGCGTLTVSLDQLIAHIKDTHIGSGKAAYCCEWIGCPRERKPFLKRHKMQNHMRTHTGERPFVCHVEGCDKKFSRPDSLNTHIKTHSNVRPFICPFDKCTKAYFHSRSLRKHAKSHESLSTKALVDQKPYCRPTKTTTQQQQQQQQQQACGTEARHLLAPTITTKFTPSVSTEMHYLAAGSINPNMYMAPHFPSFPVEQQHLVPYQQMQRQQQQQQQQLQSQPQLYFATHYYNSKYIY